MPTFRKSNGPINAPGKHPALRRTTFRSRAGFNPPRAFTLTDEGALVAPTNLAAGSATSTTLTLTFTDYTHQLTGNATGLYKGFKLACATGNFTETGNATSFPVTRKLTAAFATFTETGNATGLYKGFKLTCATGTFTETGNATGLTVQRKITCASGSFTETGIAATLTYTPLSNPVLTCTKATFTETVFATGLYRGLKIIDEGALVAPINLAAGSPTSTSLTLTFDDHTHVLTGNAATLTKGTVNNYTLTAASASFSYTYQNTYFDRTSIVAATGGTFTETGFATGLYRGLKLTCTKANFTLTGNAAGLTKQSPGAYTLAALTGNFTETVNATGLLYKRIFTLARGTFTETGNAATLAKGFRLTAQSLSLAIAGFSAGTYRGYALQSIYGSYQLVRNAATLTYTPIVLPVSLGRLTVRDWLPDRLTTSTSRSIHAHDSAATTLEIGDEN